MLHPHPSHAVSPAPTKTSRQIPPHPPKSRFPLRYVGVQGEERYLELLEKFRKRFPDDPSVDILSIDYFFLKGDYAAAEQCVIGVDRVVGGDPYLAALRSNLVRLQGDATRALALAKQAVDAEPDLGLAHISLLNTANERKDFQTVATELTILFDQFDSVPENLWDDKGEYADFLRSPEGVQWLAGRGLVAADDEFGEYDAENKDE